MPLNNVFGSLFYGTSHDLIPTCFSNALSYCTLMHSPSGRMDRELNGNFSAQTSVATLSPRFFFLLFLVEQIGQGPRGELARDDRPCSP